MVKALDHVPGHAAGFLWLLPNHCHLVLWPRGAGALADFMHVNEAQSGAEVEGIRVCGERGQPDGGEIWVKRTAKI